MQEMENYVILTSKEMENELLENFGNLYLRDAMRIISTKVVSVADDAMIHDAMCILVAMYTHKLKSGEINKGIVLH